MNFVYSGHCTFEGGMCGWINQEEGDDFDWTLARGSDNFFTGPARDYYSFSREYPMGGYVYIDAGFPRRPGDRAYLSSPSFEPTGIILTGHRLNIAYYSLCIKKSVLR